jgi:hypothetical protein
MEGAWCAAARVIRNLLGPIRATWDDQAYDTTLINVRSKPLSPVVLGCTTLQHIEKIFYLTICGCIKLDFEGAYMIKLTIY